MRPDSDVHYCFQWCGRMRWACVRNATGRDYNWVLARRLGRIVPGRAGSWGEYQQQQVPILTMPSPTQRNCYSCMDTHHDLAENGMCTLAQSDADRMHAMPATFGFLPIALAHTAPPESCTTARNISVLHPRFPCIEPT
jgi:hypothetical protein